MRWQCVCAVLLVVAVFFAAGWHECSRVHAPSDMAVGARELVARQRAAVERARVEYTRQPDSWDACYQLTKALLSLRRWERLVETEFETALTLDAELFELADRTARLARTGEERRAAAGLTRQIKGGDS